MTKEEHFRRLERMYMNAPVNEFFQPTICVTEGKAEVTMPVRSNFFHAAGAAHGCVYFKMLDDAAFFAVQSLVDDVFVPTSSFNAYFTRPVSEGLLKAIGRVVHRGSNIFVAESHLLDSQGHDVARGSGSFARGSMRLSSINDYAHGQPE